MADNSLDLRYQQDEQPNQSPFDAIRRCDDKGQEYWLGRELMKLLGYAKWDKFEPIVKDAVLDIEIIEPDTSRSHVTQLGKYNTNGEVIPTDYILSRLGAYHVALACKKRTLEVAAARRYFATKTRQAEISEQKPKLPQTFAEALRAYADELEAKERLEIENKMLVEENEQLAETVDELFDYSSIVRVAKYNNCDEKLFSWRKLKAASIQMRIDVKQVPCPRFGSKNLYHRDVWRAVYPDFSLPEASKIRLVHSTTFRN